MHPSLGGATRLIGTTTAPKWRRPKSALNRLRFAKLRKRLRHVHRLHSEGKLSLLEYTFAAYSLAAEIEALLLRRKNKRIDNQPIDLHEIGTLPKRVLAGPKGRGAALALTPREHETLVQELEASGFRLTTPAHGAPEG
jgi:hypothetical protein